MAERDLVAVGANGGERDMEKAIRRRRRRSCGERQRAETKHCFSFLLTFIYFLFLLIIFYHVIKDQFFYVFFAMSSVV